MKKNGHHVPKYYEVSSTRNPQKKRPKWEGDGDQKSCFFLLLKKKIIRVTSKFFSPMEDGVRSLIERLEEI